jgi:hypothetical protein
VRRPLSVMTTVSSAGTLPWKLRRNFRRQDSARGIRGKRQPPSFACIECSGSVFGQSYSVAQPGKLCRVSNSSATAVPQERSHLRH